MGEEEECGVGGNGSVVATTVTKEGKLEETKEMFY